MGDIAWAVGLLLAAPLLAWLGIRSRRSAYQSYADDLKRYTATTPMTVTHLEKSEIERWETQDDGSEKLMQYAVYLPTYEYTVEGKTYTYFSRQDFGSGKGVGRQVIGYYDPTDPNLITENKPARPVLSGGFFFIGAAICLAAAVMTLNEAFCWFI